MKYEKWLRRDGKDTAKICFLTLEDGAGSKGIKHDWVEYWSKTKEGPRDLKWTEIWENETNVNEKPIKIRETIKNSFGSIGLRICKICSTIVYDDMTDDNLTKIYSMVYKNSIQNIKFNPFPRKYVSHPESNKAICNFLNLKSIEEIYSEDWIDKRTEYIINSQYLEIFKTEKFYILARYEWLKLMLYIYGYKNVNDLKIQCADDLSYIKFCNPKNNKLLFYYINLLQRNIPDSVLKNFAIDIKQELNNNCIRIDY